MAFRERGKASFCLNGTPRRAFPTEAGRPFPAGFLIRCRTGYSRQCCCVCSTIRHPPGGYQGWLPENIFQILPDVRKYVITSSANWSAVFCPASSTISGLTGGS